jgi:hypothetical protein
VQEPVAFKHVCNLWIDPVTTEYIVDHCDHPPSECIPAYIGTPPAAPVPPAAEEMTPAIASDKAPEEFSYEKAGAWMVGWNACRDSMSTTPPAAPVPLTERELELIDGMIEVQLRHAEQCDGIANRTMAEKQKGWDLERVALLQKIKGNT